MRNRQFSSMAVYRNIRTIHIHIPKTAGIALGQWFAQENGDDDANVCSTPHFFLEEYLKSGVVTLDEFDGYSKIAVVRDPWERCLSAYRYAVPFRPWMTWADFLDWFIWAGKAAETGITFGMERLGARQARFFGPDDGVEVVRFERLHERFPGLPVVNKSNGQDTMSEADCRRIRDVYVEDFERFGYG